MTVFTAAALAAMIASNACVPPAVAPIVIGIAKAESGLNSWAVHDNTADVSFTPSSEDEAIRLAKALLSHGHSVDLGIGQINAPRNLGWTGLTVETAFNPCRNLAASAKVLFAKYNGSPPDSVKAIYAQRVTASISAVSDGPPPLLQAPSPAPHARMRDLLHSNQPDGETPQGQLIPISPPRADRLSRERVD
jgi:hypothetical protein